MPALHPTAPSRLPAPLAEFLGALACGQPATFRRLVLVPLQVALPMRSGESLRAAADRDARVVAKARSRRGVSRVPADTARLLAAFPPLADQVGFLALVDGEVIGCEAFGDPGSFAASRPRLLRRYARCARTAMHPEDARRADLCREESRLARLIEVFRRRADHAAADYRAALGREGLEGGACRDLRDELGTLEAEVELFARQRRILRDELELLADDAHADESADPRQPVGWLRRALVFLARAARSEACLGAEHAGKVTWGLEGPGLHGSAALALGQVRRLRLRPTERVEPE